jgi:uncharacterized protein YdiU (UPF0061 family)
MNTDNMSILGLTIDYGPYGWLEDYDPGWTPNTTDASGKRYRYGNQPLVAHWNLYQLGNAILPLVETPELLQSGLDAFLDRMEAGSSQMVAEKLGLKKFQAETDEDLKKELFEVLVLTETDMTIFFRKLAEVSCSGEAKSDEAMLVMLAPLMNAYYKPDEVVGDVKTRIANWIKDYQARVRADGTSDDARRTQMNRVNPKFVLRNYLAQLAIDKSETGDHSMITDLLEVLRRPYDEQPENEELAAKRPEWARHRAGCSMLSCSS